LKIKEEHVIFTLLAITSFFLVGYFSYLLYQFLTVGYIDYYFRGKSMPVKVYGDVAITTLIGIFGLLSLTIYSTFSYFNRELKNGDDL
jgi:hypothetical protein